MPKPVRVGLVGSQFITAVHAESLKSVPQAEVMAVCSPTPGHAEAFAAKHGIPHHLTEYKKLLEMDELDMVVLGVPNDLHCRLHARGGRGGQARRLREAALPEPRARPTAMIDGLPQGRRQADVRRGAVLRPEVRAAQEAAATTGPWASPRS